MDDDAASDGVFQKLGVTEPVERDEVTAARERNAWNLMKLGRNAEALAAYDELLARAGEPRSPEMVELTARALQTKAYLLRLSGRAEEASVVIDALLTRLNDADNPKLTLKLIDILTGQTEDLAAAEDWEGVLVALDRIATRFEGTADPALRGRVGLVLTNKAVALMKLGREREAASTYKDMVARFAADTLATFSDVATRLGRDDDPAKRRHGVAALVNRASILAELDRQDDALAGFSDVISRFEHDDDDTIQEFVAQAREHQAGLLDRQVGGDDLD